MTLYEPQGYTPEDLKRHGEMIADRLGLTSEQVRCLVPELRNALGPAVMGMGDSGPRTEEDVVDIRNAFNRIVALANALAGKMNR
jgi:hypothetical protein